MCHHSTICVLVLLYFFFHTTIWILILLYMCPHTIIHMSSHSYRCVLILLYMCPRYYYMCPRTTVCVFILLHIYISGVKDDSCGRRGQAAPAAQVQMYQYRRNFLALLVQKSKNTDARSTWRTGTDIARAPRCVWVCGWVGGAGYLIDHHSKSFKVYIYVYIYISIYILYVYI